jgi:ATP-dependent DNA helicase DinG
MNLVDEVADAFGSDGLLSQKTEHFIGRAGQEQMAVAVAQAIEGAYPLVVEASTGVGKTYAYLVPALLSGERVLVSTATKALQDQLFGRDLPRLIDVLGVAVHAALLKGRASYLCLHRMQQARHEPRLPEGVSIRALAKVEEWSTATVTGDLAELSGLDERSPLIPLITSTRENCLGAQCPRYRACHVNLARREAMAADIVVINHHLFFADLAVRESGVAELLPSVRIAIFDEAHQLNETGIQFLGANLTTGQLLDFARDLMATGLQLARGLVDWQALAGAVELAARQLRLCVGRQAQGAKLRWTGDAPESVMLKAVLDACVDAGKQIATVSEIAPDFVRLQERAVQLVERASRFMIPSEPGFVRWADAGSQLRLAESPLDISKAVKEKMLGTPDGSAKTWIFTSATLGDNDRLTWFTEPCGLAEAKTLRVGSPFNYEAQAALYIPRDFPKPSDPAHSQQVAVSTGRWVKALGGRTMVLTTTLRALRAIADTLQDILGDAAGIDVLMQGAMPKRQLIERFRLGATDGRNGCVLVASASFWEGIDVPGDALQLVVIDKLPFPALNDPLAEARSKRIESEGRSAFNEFFLPEAAVALKQGAGRLIRRETDQGILVVCDVRLTTMGYGRRLIKALPPMRLLQDESQMALKLAQLTRTCTTACQLP